MKPSKQQESAMNTQLSGAHHDFEKKLNIHAFFRVPDRAISEDLVQETFLKTWSYLVKGGKIDIMKSFLYHVLNHLIIDEYRKNKIISLDAMLENGFQPHSANHAEHLINVMDGKAAQLLIQRLPEKYRTVMQMRYVQDLTIKEMSLITGQSRNVTSVQLHRGLQKLKVLYFPR